MARILDSIDSPDKLKLLTDEELSILAQEIREEIINVTSKTGGHVASSLGAVEIILAVHSLIDSPHDRFLFDVGHQSYAHMLITGRLNEFPTLRQYKGLSGFPKPHSNPHDVHPSGSCFRLAFRSVRIGRVHAIYVVTVKRSWLLLAMLRLLVVWHSRRSTISAKHRRRSLSS